MNGGVMNLAKDLRAYRFRKTFSKFIICIALWISLGMVFYFYKDSVFPFHKTYQIICIIFIPLFFAILAAFKLKLFDHSWQGTIIAVKIKEGVGTFSVGGRPWPYTKNDIIITIRKNNKKIVEYTPMSLGVKERTWIDPYVVGKIENHIDEYGIGDSVYHFYGFDYLFHVHKSPLSTCRCIVCGEKNDTNRGTCWNCNHSLIQSI